MAVSVIQRAVGEILGLSQTPLAQLLSLLGHFEV